MVDSLKLILASCALVVAAGSADAGPRDRLAGTYIATVGGSSVALVLNADGTGSLAGDAGRWKVAGRSITLIDGEGSQVTGSVSGNTLTFNVDGQTIRFVKRTAAKKAPTTTTSKASGRPFKPKLVAGKKIRPSGAGGSFRLPRGWKHGWGEGADGNDAYNATNKKQTIVLSLGRTMLTGDEGRSDVVSLIDAALAELLEGAAVEHVVATEEFTVGGKMAGRTVVRGNLGGEQIEGYLGVVFESGWAFSIVGLYKTADAKEGRAAADTVLATLRVKAPKTNKRLMARIAGCWSFYESYDGGYTQITLKLAADGTYHRSYVFSLSNVDSGTGYDSSSASDIDKTSGSWVVFGKQLTLVPDGKGKKIFDVAVKSGRLYLGKRRYSPCS